MTTPRKSGQLLPQLDSARGHGGSVDAAQGSQMSSGRRSSAPKAALPPDFLAEFGNSVGSDWQVQSPQEVLQEAKENVRRRRPGEELLDDHQLELLSRPQDKSHRGCHIILPDNRVRAMEDQLSARVRARLLDEGKGPMETPRAPRPQRRRPQAESRPRAPPKPRTPWYLPPTQWFNKEGTGENDEGGGGFPYDGRYKAAEQDGAEGGPLSQKEKDSLQIVEAYKQYMKEDKRMVVKCQDADEAAKMLTGEYEEQAPTQQDRGFPVRPIYKKAAGRAEVFLAYWEGRDGIPEGWRFSNKLGVSSANERPVQVYGLSMSAGEQPPVSGWRIPWDSSQVRTTFQVKEKPQRKPAFLQ